MELGSCRNAREGRDRGCVCFSNITTHSAVTLRGCFSSWGGSLHSYRVNLSVTSTRPSSHQCCMRVNLSCLPDDLISVNRMIVKYFDVMKLRCDALLWHWWHIQLSEAHVAVVFFHSRLNEWSSQSRPHDIQSKCHTHWNSFQVGVILYRLKEAGDLPWVADQKI
jgi:hypothetical protein